MRCVKATCVPWRTRSSPYTPVRRPRRRGATLAYPQDPMKTLRFALLAAVALGCHFDKLFQPSGGGHAPPVGSTNSRLRFTTQPHSTMRDSTIPPVQVTALDSAGNVVMSFTGNVTVAIGHDGSLLGSNL